MSRKRIRKYLVKARRNRMRMARGTRVTAEWLNAIQAKLEEAQRNPGSNYLCKNCGLEIRKPGDLGTPLICPFCEVDSPLSE